MLFIGDSQASRANLVVPKPDIMSYKGASSTLIANKIQHKSFSKYETIIIMVGSVDCLNGIHPAITSTAIKDIHQSVRATNSTAKVLIYGLPNMNSQHANQDTVTNFNRTIQSATIKNLKCRHTAFVSTTTVKLEKHEHWKNIHFNRLSLKKFVPISINTFDKYHQ
jgi:hypothetical protein